MAQSIAWAYAPGRELGSPPIEGIVLRHGHLYGPGTGADAAGDAPAVHVDAAAMAAVLALGDVATGVYNVADPSGALSTTRATAELGWDASFRQKR